MTHWRKRRVFFLGAIIFSLQFWSCAGESDYPQQAKDFYSKYARSREVDWLVQYNLKPRANTLYLQECQRAPDDATKIWAIYENYAADEKITLANLKIALTPFADSGGMRIVPEYQAIAAADTAGVLGESILQARNAIRAFQKLGLREVICSGPNVTYLVHQKFMLIFVADAAKTPDSIKNIAAKLDENWYYEISFEHQAEQRRKLSTALREFWESLESQPADTMNKN
jgi:hypothetical protein